MNKTPSVCNRVGRGVIRSTAVLGVLLMLASLSFGATVKFAWDAPVSGAPAGYRLYYSPNADLSSPIIAVDVAGTVTQATVTINPGVRYWYVTAYYYEIEVNDVPQSSTILESDKSNILKVKVNNRPAVSGNFRFVP